MAIKIGTSNEILDRIKIKLLIEEEYILAYQLGIEEDTLIDWRGNNNIDYKTITSFLDKNNISEEGVINTDDSEDFGRVIQIDNKNIYVIDEGFGLLLALKAYVFKTIDYILPYLHKIFENDILCIIMDKDKLTGHKITDDDLKNDIERFPNGYLIVTIYDLLKDDLQHISKQCLGLKDRAQMISKEKLSTKEYEDIIIEALSINTDTTNYYEALRAEQKKH
ncbi:MAG: hypothetical protein JXQ77_05620 [Campylobacterales bacterium]|nr:hypothetical protein [Campylobacterales bacterium]